MSEKPIIIATRGSALALAQANFVLAECRRSFPDLGFDLKVIKTTGDKLQKVSMSRIDASLPRGLFTKELEMALLDGTADLAVHSLKDLPTDLPAGLMLGGVAGQREDVRDVLIYRNNIAPATKLSELPKSLTVSTSSTRRKAQILAARPDFLAIEIRGNVPTRLQKLATQEKMDVTILAAAGLSRLKYRITAEGTLSGESLPEGLGVTILDTREMLPCVGQGALGLEIRANDPRMASVCEKLNHDDTLHAVTAERSLLRAMGGGCQAPIGAHAWRESDRLYIRAVSFLQGNAVYAEGSSEVTEADQLGRATAAKLGFIRNASQE